MFSVTYYGNYVETIARKGEFGLILFDVNGLKQINDNMGHEKGDEDAKSMIERADRKVSRLIIKKKAIIEEHGEY